MLPFPKRGLYAITPNSAKPLAQLCSEVDRALRGGVAVIQYREKSHPQAVERAAALLTLCHRYHIPLIINDSVSLAAEIGADGVHLGREDTEIQIAQQQLGTHAIIGVSCYNDVQRAIHAQHQGASYVAFGRFFDSYSKPLATQATLETLIAAKTQLTIPIVAIGGILPNNAQPLLTAGADVLAVIQGVFAQTDAIETSAQAYQCLFN